MTGKYPIHTGMQHTVLYAAEPRGLPLTEKILPQYLQDLGYVWNNGKIRLIANLLVILNYTWTCVWLSRALSEWNNLMSTCNLTSCNMLGD